MKIELDKYCKEELEQTGYCLINVNGAKYCVVDFNGELLVFKLTKSVVAE